MPLGFLVEAVIAGLLASVACGLGAIPAYWSFFNPEKHTDLAYGFAGGLMFSASVYNLILPGLQMNGSTALSVGPVLAGILLGAAFLWLADAYLSPERVRGAAWTKWGSRKELLIFIAMTVHSLPEGVAVGVGYTSGEIHHTNLGLFVATAIAIHNIPEGLAIAIPMRENGARFGRSFLAAFLTSLPQPIATVPAAVLAWFFQPLLPVLMGFAAGAMIFLVLLEMIPEALHTGTPIRIAWSFTLGFCAMLLVQGILT
jgi:ZIP family zinc transporter